MAIPNKPSYTSGEIDLHPFMRELSHNQGLDDCYHQQLHQLLPKQFLPTWFQSNYMGCGVVRMQDHLVHDHSIMHQSTAASELESTLPIYVNEFDVVVDGQVVHHSFTYVNIWCPSEEEANDLPSEYRDFFDRLRPVWTLLHQLADYDDYIRGI